MVMPHWLKDKLERESKEKGISMAELIKDVLKQHVAKQSKQDQST